MNEGTKEENGLKIVSLFDQGKKFTEELLKENERLRQVVKNLTQENRALANKSSEAGAKRMEDKIRLLEDEAQELKQEVEEQKKETAAMEEENREFAERYVQVERQNSDLISMYVASYQLHSTLDYDEVVKIVKDITINMIGGEIFGIYLIDREAGRLLRIAEEGFTSEGDESIPLDGEVAQAIIGSGKAHLASHAEMRRSSEEPLAYIPLSLDDELIGVIKIDKLLIQKDGFLPVDFELVELLGKHAATAIYSARLHTVSERKRTTLEGFVDLMKSGGAEATTTK